MTTLTEFLLARIAEDEEASRVAQRVPEAAQNITRWHPARVLAECEAKRRIVEDLGFREHTLARRLSIFGERVLGYLALPYADHPDYDEAWRP